MPNYVNGAQWLPTPNGIQVPAIVYKDSAGNLAIPQTPYVISAAGLLLPAPVDASNNPLLSLAAGNAVVPPALQNAAVATGPGTNIDVSGMSTAVFKVSGTFAGTVVFEVTTDETDANGWTVVDASQIGGGIITSASAPGLYRANVAGLKMARARVSAWTSGSITVTARLTPLESPNKAVNASVVGSLVNKQTNAAVTANTNILLSNYTPAIYQNSKLVVGASTSGVLYVVIDGVALTMNSGVALIAGAAYSFDIPLISGSTYNLQLSVSATMQVKWEAI